MYQTTGISRNVLSPSSSTGPSVLNETVSVFEAEAMPYVNDLYRTALRILRHPADAADAVQDTYLQALKSFHRYETGTNCKAWLFRILFNVVRHQRRGAFKWLTGKEEDIAQLECASAAAFSTELDDRAILAALDGLPRQYREVILLVDVQEFSYKETSTILAVPIGTVMSRVSRGRLLLRDALSGVAAAYGIARTS